MVKYKYSVEKLLSLKSKPAMSSKFSTPVPGLDFCTTQHNSPVFTRIQLLKYLLAANVFSDDPTLLLYAVMSTHRSTGSSLYVKSYLNTTFHMSSPFAISFSQFCISSHLYSTLLITPQHSKFFLKRPLGNPGHISFAIQHVALHPHQMIAPLNFGNTYQSK